MEKIEKLILKSRFQNTLRDIVEVFGMGDELSQLSPQAKEKLIWVLYDGNPPPEDESVAFKRAWEMIQNK